MTLAALIDAFLAWCARHRAPATVRFYADRLQAFRAKYGAREAASLHSLEIDEYLYAARTLRSGRPASPSTRHHDAVALTTLQSFALREKLLERAWFPRLEKPPMGRRDKIPSPEQIRKLLQHAGPEFRAIYTALAQSGARPGELVRAQIADVEWAKKRIVLTEHKTAAKTGRPRVIAIGAGLARMLRAAIGDRAEGAIFLAPGGQPWSVSNLSAMHRRLRDKAGLPEWMCLYNLRHRFGTELIRKGAPIKDVADLMGHATTATTEIYLHRDVEELAADQDRIPELPAADEPPPAAAAE